MRPILLLCLLLSGCGPHTAAPAAIRLSEDACAHCRMTIVSINTAAQIVTSEDEPLFFDELGCVSNFIAAHPPAADATVFVADHRTGEWIRAADAVFTRTRVQTPMSSGLLAHATESSRDADPAARGGAPVAAIDLLQPRHDEVRP